MIYEIMTEIKNIVSDHENIPEWQVTEKTELSQRNKEAIMMDCEIEFDVSFSLEDFDEIRTVGHLIDRIKEIDDESEIHD